MIYNLDLFGKKLEKMRKSLNLTQKEISELTYIDSVTIRRIEKGKVIPKLDTLEILSPVFKEDLTLLLLQYRFDDYSVFYEIKNRIESKLDGGELHSLNRELKELNNLLSSTKNTYYKNLITQLILLTEGIVLYKDNNDKSMDKLIKAIRITTSNFNLDDYDSFVYSSMEIRILMNIAFILNKLNHKGKYIEIMEFCINSVDSNDEVYSKVCHNLAGAYRRNKDFEKALEYSNMGIKSCQENRNLNGLNLLYYGKGIAEYKLNKNEYIDSLKISIYLCKALGQDKLKDTIIHNCKEIFRIDL
ncbi:helix-turn-helix domain-containing protein [Wansuia hejianensis]|uniref:Helix-turn-helix transcriptional regulator n=1 Tax=Wansuia hejianensis TaxID=2763667 RepID=A0A926F3A6_9FIRM|nr:helix-turn-helix transcriptional regulator [Wansuia hejianensis]MBC8591175.1 helix-turn-helix transcriptional regulator [Wansuia hejianensis]